ncbi:MAG: hypothetical protein H0W36_04180 [Gemmatimonadetes bacterium]|nr:hypothetical protein [Gemmatimonadota bacterium]
MTHRPSLRLALAICAALLAGLAAAALRDGRIGIGAPTSVEAEAETGKHEGLMSLVPGDTVRAACIGSRALQPIRSVRLLQTIDRLLPDERGLLAVTEMGLQRWTGDGWEAVLEGGRDYALRADTILRLDGEKVEFFPARPGARAVPARGSDSSIAVAMDGILLHSVTNRNNFLLTRRAIDDGRVEEYWLPVERDFVRLFMNDFETLLEASGRVRSAFPLAVFVPLLANPIPLIDMESRRVTDLYTLAREPGRVATIRREMARAEATCPTCRRVIRESTSHRYDRIHADAAFAGRNLWVLGSETPGSNRAIVYRFPLDSLVGPAVAAYRLAGFATPPRALAIAGEDMIVAAEDRLYWFTRPDRNPEGGACEETI